MVHPLGHLANWSPFRLDALGLVTLLGAEEVSTAIGALQRNRYIEFLPLLGSHLVAEDKVTTPLPGFTLYNISDGAYVPVISGWFSRWLIANMPTKKRGALLTFVELGEETQRLDATDVIANVIAIVIGAAGNGGLITIAALQGDYYGIANATAMLASVLVRYAMLRAKRDGRNRLVPKSADKTELVKIVIRTPDDKVAISTVQRKFLRLIIADLGALQSGGVVRASGWIAFATHVVSIGQASLLSQLLSVGLIAFATVLAITRFGNDSEEAGGKLRIKSDPIEGHNRDILLSLVPTEKEKLVLQKYWQLPCSMEEAEKQKWSFDFWGYWDENIKKMAEEKEKQETTASQTHREEV